MTSLHGIRKELSSLELVSQEELLIHLPVENKPNFSLYQNAITTIETIGARYVMTAVADDV